MPEGSAAGRNARTEADLSVPTRLCTSCEGKRAAAGSAFPAKSPQVVLSPYGPSKHRSLPSPDGTDPGCHCGDGRGRFYNDRIAHPQAGMLFCGCRGCMAPLGQGTGRKSWYMGEQNLFAPILTVCETRGIYPDSGPGGEVSSSSFGCTRSRFGTRRNVNNAAANSCP